MRKMVNAALSLFILFSCNPESGTKSDGAQLGEKEIRLPENARQGLQVAPDLESRLFAAEPLVRNPTNIDVDHLGRVWVVENVNYRPANNPDNSVQEGGDMVVILEDTDGDGQADGRKVFFQDPVVDGAMGIGVLGNQVYLSTSPHILVLTDVNEDDVADRVDTLFTGMGPKQNDHAVHAVSFGPDGRLYFNYGNAAREMQDKMGQTVTDKLGNLVKWTGDPYQHGMVFRCEMDGSGLESLGYNFRNNYEVCVDSYGRMWQSDNDDDGNRAVRLNYVMEYGNFGYADERTGASWREPRSGMHPDIPARHWHQNDPGVVPNLLITGSGSPCGITFYEGDLLPGKYREQLLHADAGPGTVRLVSIEEQGAGFQAREEHLLARKADSWYRPTDVAVAPDGSVFVADWYDPGVGGHWAGDNVRGRIFRIAPNPKKYHIQSPKFNKPKTAAKALKSPNPATRYLAWTALADMRRRAESALGNLWDSSNPLYRARALWLLARVEEQHLKNGLEDDDPLIRATAVRVARQLYADRIISILQFMAEDPSPKVRREVAIALRELPSDMAPDIWAELAVRHTRDRWYLEALGIGATGRWDECLAAWLKRVDGGWDTPAGRDIIWRSRGSQTLNYLLRILEDGSLSAAEAARFLRSTDFLNDPDKNRKLAGLINLPRRDRQAFQTMLLTHIDQEFAVGSGEVRRTLSTLLPGLRGTTEYLEIVGKLGLKSEAFRVYQMAVSRPDHEVGVRAAQLLLDLEGEWSRFAWGIKGTDRPALVKLLGHINRKEGKDLLFEVALDPDEDLSLRRMAVESLAKDWGWETRMRDLLARESLPTELYELAAGKLLLANRPVDRSVGSEYLDRQMAGMSEMPPIEELIARRGDAERGQQIFSTHCMTCHQVDFLGTAFGPDLTEVGNKLGRRAMYSAILYPDAGISHGFAGMHYEMADGNHYEGYVISDEAEVIKLKVQSGTTVELSKPEIVTTNEMDHSLMTAGLEKVLGERDLVNVVEYLTTLSNEATMVPNPYQGKIDYQRGTEE